MHRLRHLWVVLWIFSFPLQAADDTEVIEQQLKEVGEVPYSEVAVIQTKYTRKNMRHELTPFAIGGVPFGTFRRTLAGGASYALHINDWFAVEPLNFMYTRNFFSSFADDVNASPTGRKIKPDIEKLVFMGTLGVQFTPFYGKASTFSRDIGYLEPLFTGGAGLAKTETNNYFAFYPGIGFRIFFREWIALRMEFRNYMYFENFINRDTGAAESALRSNYTIMASLSFWLPKMPR